MFRKLRGVRLPYNVQGLIYFTCATYRQQDQKTKAKIRELCNSVGGEYAGALFDVLTKAGQYSVELDCMEHYTSAWKLSTVCGEDFIESWDANERS